jgi:hypothetical protein
MRIGHWAILTATLVCLSCGSREPQSFTPSRAAEVEKDVRAFAATVAHDITQEGPAAWNRHFADSPSFFMASEGHLAFPDRATATAAIQGLVRITKQIDLQWGNDLRVDPLTPDLAMLAASYHEVRLNNDASRIDENGFFTGLAEHRDGRWQFRNAHWSVASPPPAAH